MQIVTLQFPFQLHPGLIPNFRAAIVDHVGIGHHLFHGHDNSEQGKTKYSNAYPLIRFAVRKGFAQIMGMGEGCDAIIRYLLPAIPSTFVIAGRPYDTAGWRMNTYEWEPLILPEYRSFSLYQWVALNKGNYKSWKEYVGNDGARRLILDRCLTGHLRALAETCGLDQPSRQRIVARVLQQDRVKKINWHGTRLVGFDVVAEANFQPPLGLGLGRCHSFGFGEVCSPTAYAALTNVKLKPNRKGKKRLENGMATSIV